MGLALLEATRFLCLHVRILAIPQLCGSTSTPHVHHTILYFRSAGGLDTLLSARSMKNKKAAHCTLRCRYIDCITSPPPRQHEQIPPTWMFLSTFQSSMPSRPRSSRNRPPSTSVRRITLTPCRASFFSRSITR